MAEEFSVFVSTGFVRELGISETVGFLVSVAGEFSGLVSTGFVAEVVSAFWSSNLVSVCGAASPINSLPFSDVRQSEFLAITSSIEMTLGVAPLSENMISL